MRAGLKKGVCYKQDVRISPRGYASHAFSVWFNFEKARGVEFIIGAVDVWSTINM